MYRRPVILLIRRPLPLILCLIAATLLFSGSIKFISVLGEGLQNKIIVIDAGHGGQDPGTQYNGLKEKDINLDIALRLNKLLSAKGCKVILTRDKDEDFYQSGLVTGRIAKRAELSQRLEVAATNNADIFISIHTNSFPQRSSYGMETYYNEESPSGKALAERIQSQLLKLQPDNKRTVKAGDYYLLNQIKIPAVIVEVGFLSNARESKMLSQDHYKNAIAQSIMVGIEQYFYDFPFGLNAHFDFNS